MKILQKTLQFLLFFGKDLLQSFIINGAFQILNRYEIPKLCVLSQKLVHDLEALFGLIDI